jgi:acetylornithine deacetylase/succinyl-diaminopimelate desuccinylase-like protein
MRADYLYGRGASDMKGQTLAGIKALESVMQTAGKLPINVKFLIEGEEEIGSRHLRQFIRQEQELLACDYALNADAGMVGVNQPAITLGLRGGMRVNLSVFGPRHDVHSGVFGGALHNPAQALIELLANLHDAQGRVCLPGFYDRVRPLSAEERLDLAQVGIDERFFIETTGVPALWGEPEFTPFERTTARPTLEILAFHAGLAGEGSLNIVPARADAAISFRLVPDQEPDEVYRALLAYLETHAPPTIRWEISQLVGGRGVLMGRDTPGIQPMTIALEKAWGVQPRFTRLGGGIPVVNQLKEELGIPSVLTGFGLPDDNIHGPNERLHLPTWRTGIQALIWFLYEAAA